MRRINPYHVLNLAPADRGLCISLYANSERDLAGLVDQAENLCLREMEPRAADRLLRPVHNFTKNLCREKTEFPVAIFSTNGFYGYARLPFTTKPLAVVAESFHVKPLLKWMQREHPFSLLVLKEQEGLLYQGSLTHFELLETLPYRELRTMDGAFNALDRAVYRSIQSSRVPLLLAGDIELIEIYKNVSGYRAIVDDPIVDPSVFEDEHKLHVAATKCLEPFLEQRENGFLSSYWSAERSGRTSSQLQEIVSFALQGRVKHLFVNERMQVWGKIDPITGQCSYSAKQTDTVDDVLDDLAEIVHRSHGAVTVLPADKMPNGCAACAILTGEAIALRWTKSRRSYFEGNVESQAVS